MPAAEIYAGAKYDQDSVNAQLCTALFGSSLPKFEPIESIGYKGTGALVDLCPELKGILYSVLTFDNDSAHVGAEVETKLVGKVCAAARRTGPGMPLGRNAQEGSFRELRRAGLNRLRGSNAVVAERRIPIDLVELAAITDLLQFERNSVKATNASAGEHRVTLMRSVLTESVNIRGLPTLRQAELIRELSSIYNKVTVRGNLSKGQPAYVEWNHARYTSTSFGSRTDLIGAEVLLEVNTQDVSAGAVIDFVTKSRIDQVMSQGRWSGEAHSLAERSEIHRLIEAKIVVLRPRETAIGAYRRHREEQLKSKKSLSSTQTNALAAQSIKQRASATVASVAEAASQPGGAQAGRHRSGAVPGTEHLDLSAQIAMLLPLTTPRRS